MPPPPPPSKSYLLVLDTDSEEEDKDEQPLPLYSENNEELLSSHIVPVEHESLDKKAAVTTPGKSAGSRRPHVIEDDEEDEEDFEACSEADATAIAVSMNALATQLEPFTSEEKPSNSSCADGSTSSTSPINLSKNQKKNKKKRKKKKSKQESTLEDDDEEQQERYLRRVTFSNVSVRTYPRAFSQDAVPSSGGWPLGMSRDGYQDLDLIPLDDYETRRQEDLRERWHSLRRDDVSAELLLLSAGCSSSKKHNPMNSEAIMNFSIDTSKDFPFLETRQWDYRDGAKNPLFGLLPEEKRQSLFLEASTPPIERHGGSSGGSSPSNIIHHQHIGRARAYSVTSGSIPLSTGSTNQFRRPRSNSIGSLNNNGSHHSTNNNNTIQHQEQFNETYNQVYVHHIRNELEQLRNERNKSGSTGCNCRKLSVYIPPKDGSGGKKAQHRRMKPGKLAQELKKRHIYDPSASREAMEKTLHDAVGKEPCCKEDGDCFCVRNGIDCQADACSCWHDSHVHSKSRAGEQLPSTEEIKKRCGNPLGTYVVDLDAIDTFRRKLLQKILLEQVLERDCDNESKVHFCLQCPKGTT